MKVGLVLPGNIWFSPYVRIYTQMLDELGVCYDIISWNRDGTDQKEGFQYEEKCSNKSNRLFKFLPYIRYTSYVKNILIRNKYERLIIFGPQIGIFISRFLAKKYCNRYIFDYRDLSIEQKKLFKSAFRRVLKNSYTNVISSPGFLNCLPTGYDYMLSHNFDIKIVKNVLKQNKEMLRNHDVIKVLTIGGIRDFESNIEIVDALSNKSNFIMQFVGKGIAADSIKKYVQSKCINNVEFEGYYPKNEEAKYIQSSTFINIYYPSIISHSTALSNRFYNALIYKKPMIVTADSIQGEFVKKYGLGLVLNDCSNLDEKLNKFILEFDYETFEHNCNELLSSFIKDAETLRSSIVKFLE